jgi:CRISPR-associated protein Cas1
MSWRTVFISNPASLCVEQGSLVVKQEQNKAKIPMEDIGVLVLEHAQISITAPALSALAEAQVAVITVNASHLPNGVLLPFLSHSRALKVLRTQMQVSQPVKKRLWQHIVSHKINNQACVLAQQGLKEQAEILWGMASSVRSGDSLRTEAKAAQYYFKHVFGKGFNRSQDRFYNAAVNYGYAVIRGVLARNAVAYGFLPALGLFHCSEQNAFNLADDLIEPYRPVLDLFVLQHFPQEPQHALDVASKTTLVRILQQDVAMTFYGGNRGGKCTVLAAAETTVTSLSSVFLSNVSCDQLAMPVLAGACAE